MEPRPELAVPDAEGKWQCPNCRWYEKKHPLFVWGPHNIRAVEVHQTMLCPSLKEKP